MNHYSDFCCPCGSFLGWKQIKLGGKSLSKSYNDLRGAAHSNCWVWDSTPASMDSDYVKHVSDGRKSLPPPGSALIEQLPPEILGEF